MPTVRLTEARINALEPGKSARDVRDAALKGFGVRIMPSGRKRFFLHTQHEGSRVWKLIGEPVHNLATEGHGTFLRLGESPARQQAEPDGDPGTRTVKLLDGAVRPLSQRKLRQRAGLRNETVSTTLRQLCGAGTVIRSRDGYSLGRTPALFSDDMLSGRQN